MERLEQLIKRLIELVSGARADDLEMKMNKATEHDRHDIRRDWVAEKVKSYVASAAVAVVTLIANMALDHWIPEQA